MHRLLLASLISAGCSLNSAGTAEPPTSLRDDTGTRTVAIADTAAPAVDSSVVVDALLDDVAEGSIDSSVVASDAKPETTSDAKTTCTEPGGIVYGGHCYFPLTASATWAQQRDQCSLKGAHLVTSTSGPEQTAVEKVASGDRFIGLFKSGSLWIWVAAESSTYQHWKAKEPNMTGDCAHMDAKGEWRDGSCDEGHPAICERDSI